MIYHYLFHRKVSYHLMIYCHACFTFSYIPTKTNLLTSSYFDYNIELDLWRPLTFQNLNTIHFSVVVHVDGVRRSFRTVATKGPVVNPIGDIWAWRALMEYWQGKTEEIRENAVPLPLLPPQIPHGVTRARTLASAVICQRLTTWAMDDLSVTEVITTIHTRPRTV
jgi:hypothetical protein